MLKNIDFYHLQENLSNKYGKRVLDTGINASRKVIHEAAKKTGDFLGNKIADAVAKSYNDKIKKAKTDEETIIPPLKKQ